MEQFFLVPASVNSKKLNARSVTKQELLKYYALQNPTKKIISLEKEINRKLFAKTNIFVVKKLSCLRIKLSNLPAFFWMV